MGKASGILDEALVKAADEHRNEAVRLLNSKTGQPQLSFEAKAYLNALLAIEGQLRILVTERLREAQERLAKGGSGK